MPITAGMGTWPLAAAEPMEALIGHLPDGTGSGAGVPVPWGMRVGTRPLAAGQTSLNELLLT